MSRQGFTLQGFLSVGCLMTLGSLAPGVNLTAAPAHNANGPLARASIAAVSARPRLLVSPAVKTMPPVVRRHTAHAAALGGAAHFDPAKGGAIGGTVMGRKR